MNNNFCKENIGRIESEERKISEELSKFQNNDIEKQEKEIGLKLKELKNQDLTNLIMMKNSYANKIFRFICIWSFIVITILICQGFKIFNFNLNDVIITTLIGASFIQVIGLMYIVLNHIFSNNN